MIAINKYILLLGVLLLLQQNINAQNENDRAFIMKRTNVEALNELAQRSRNHQTNALKKATEQGLIKEIVYSNNIKAYLSGFDLEGNPVYDFDDNINAAITILAYKIWIGGTSGLDLDGSGVQIGHWEAKGLALPSHQELIGKITYAENVTTSSHATHTASTMVGTGVVSKARGIASGATVLSYKSDDDESELAEFGAAGGILSNHSYSTANPDGNIPLYGLYSSSSREWDEILYYAPYLTSCKSAGNTRNDEVNTGDNGYDLVYTVAVSKNILTIGAVADISKYINPGSVNQSSFSSWGPTDDWRIKPDIVANGVSLYGADYDDNTDYISKSGTSMAAASVAGAIALLQQHYHNENGVYMKSATVKALLTGTSDEAGDNDGPDFQNGWGLLNAERAAEVISNNGELSGIYELSLLNGNNYTTTLETDGISSFSLTIAWTDPPGILTEGGIDDQTPMLVNDLDVRITSDDFTYEPWVLTPNSESDNFTQAATKGDNFRDNVERIDVSELPKGIYKITVSHKDSLVNGFQDFSMVFNGISESVLKLKNLNNQDISIYPNPSGLGQINILIPDFYNSNNFCIQIFDLTGNLIKSEIIYEKQFNLDVSNINSGVYIIKIQDGQRFYKQLIVIEN